MTTDSHSKGATYHDRIRAADPLALVDAALHAERIVINGDPFKPAQPASSDELTDLLYAALGAPGKNVWFHYEDGSYCAVSVLSTSNRGAADEKAKLWIECGSSHGGRLQ